MDVPSGPVEFEESNELEFLRRRAYGPDADIAGDTVAQARLSELEAAQRRPPAPSVDAVATASASPPERIPVPAHPGGSRTEPEKGSVATHSPDHGNTAAAWWGRRRWFVILGGAIAVLALNAALVPWMSQLIAEGSTPVPTGTPTADVPSVPYANGRFDGPIPSDYVLAVKSVGADADQPKDLHGTLKGLGISTDELRRYEDFLGLNVWSGESRYGMTCLFVAVPGQGLREGFGAEGCSPKGIDTITEFVDGSSSEFLTRFVLSGEFVNVYEYVRTDPITSRR